MGERAYGYVRIETGDELSKRAKFALITWVGDEVPPLKKAKVSTDKASVKQTIQVMNLVFFGVLAFLGFHVLTFSLVKFSPVRFSFSTSCRLFIPLFWMCCLQQSCFGYLAAFLCISCPLTPRGYLK